jgi:hypothetical protein
VAVRFKYKAQLNVPASKREAEQLIFDAIEMAVKISLKDWLQAIAGSGGRVPLYTGMARASLFKVAQLSGGTLLLSPLKGASRISMGKALGTASITREGNAVIFRFSSGVPHWQEQETNPGISPTAPWQSLPAAANAFTLRFPDVFKFPQNVLAFKRITVNG